MVCYNNNKIHFEPRYDITFDWKNKEKEYKISWLKMNFSVIIAYHASRHRIFNNQIRILQSAGCTSDGQIKILQSAGCTSDGQIVVLRAASHCAPLRADSEGG